MAHEIGTCIMSTAHHCKPIVFSQSGLEPEVQAAIVKPAVTDCNGQKIKIVRLKVRQQT